MASPTIACASIWWGSPKLDPPYCLLKVPVPPFYVLGDSI
jgi:hypothetical protein